MATGIFPQPINDSVKQYLESLFVASRFNPANTATGESSVKINATSGIAVFTGVVAAASASVFFIQNTYFDGTQQSANPTLYYHGAGQPTIVSSTFATPGYLAIEIKNLHASDNTDSNLTITFQIT